MKWKVPALGVLIGGLCAASTSLAWNTQPVVFHNHGDTQPENLQILDFDGDGRNDVLTTNVWLDGLPANDHFGQSVVLFRQRPDGGLAEPTVIFKASTLFERRLQTSLAADINRDGRIDLMIGTAGGLEILLRQANGSFSRIEHPAPITDAFAANGIVRLALYDVDEDGIRDIVAQTWRNEVAVYYLSAQGSVREVRTFNVPLQGRNDVEVADLDHDGKPDLVMSTEQGNQNPDFMILGPDGSGGLVLRTGFAYDSIFGPQSIAIGDYDGDGREELAAVQNVGEEIGWVDIIKFDSSLNIVDVSSLPSHEYPSNLLAGDVNGDGLTDLSLTHVGWPRVGRYLQFEGGLLAETGSKVDLNTALRNNAMAIGDINGDRCPDTAITDYYYLLQVVYGMECDISPLPTVDLSLSVSSQPMRQFEAGLYNRGVDITIKYPILPGTQIPIEHPRARIVLKALPGQTLKVRETRLGAGSCDTVSETPQRAEYLCRGDDMMYSDTGLPVSELTQTFSIYLDHAEGSRFDVWASLDHDSIVFDTNLDNQVRSARVDFLTGTGITAAPRHADFNGDGKSDLLWHDTVTRNNVIWKSANNTLRKSVTAVTDPAWVIAGQGDFDGDGDSDILWRHHVHGGNTLWKSASSLSRQNLTGVTNLDWEIAGIGDFDGNGRSDILWRNPRTGANAIWRSGDYTDYQAVASVTGTTWKIAGVGDFDGDSRSDILWRNSATGANAIWKSGNTLDRVNVTGVTNLDWKVAGVGDFDHDGTSDILWRNGNTGVNAIWKAANSSAQQGVMGVTHSSWKIASVGDYDGDGTSDILWRSDSTGVGAIWKAGNYATQQAIGTMASSWSIVR